MTSLYVVNLMTREQDMSDIPEGGEKLVCGYLQTFSVWSHFLPFLFLYTTSSVHSFCFPSCFSSFFLLNITIKMPLFFFYNVLLSFCFQSCSWGSSKGEPGSSWWSRASCHVSISTASCPSLTEKLTLCGGGYTITNWDPDRWDNKHVCSVFS